LTNLFCYNICDENKGFPLEIINEWLKANPKEDINQIMGLSDEEKRKIKGERRPYMIKLKV